MKKTDLLHSQNHKADLWLHLKHLWGLQGKLGSPSVSPWCQMWCRAIHRKEPSGANSINPLDDMQAPLWLQIMSPPTRPMREPPIPKCGRGGVGMQRHLGSRKYRQEAKCSPSYSGPQGWRLGRWEGGGVWQGWGKASPEALGDRQDPSLHTCTAHHQG